MVYWRGMSRIQTAYEYRYRELLLRFGARRPDQGVNWLVRRARELKEGESVSLADSLTRVARELAAKSLKTRHPLANNGENIRFFCDSGLGGLARWLRGSGYEAFWEPSIDDYELLQRAQKLHTTVLTTDSLLMERTVVRDHDSSFHQQAVRRQHGRVELLRTLQQFIVIDAGLPKRFVT